MITKVSRGVRNWTGGVSVPDEAPAWPAAYLAVREWLNNFPYRIDLGWPVFVLAGGAALVLAFATVGFLAFRAAAADPVESLRYE
jgi:putative ABC transport system permease protein